MSSRSAFRYGLANIGQQSIVAFTMGFVPAALERTGARPLAVGAVLALAPLCLLLIQPIVARHSDGGVGRWSRWGYILIGALISSIGLLSFGRSSELFAKAFSYLLIWAGFAIARGPYMAELCESFAPEVHSAVSGVQSQLGGVATLILFFLGPTLESLEPRLLGDTAAAVVILSAALAAAPATRQAMVEPEKTGPSLTPPLRRFYAAMAMTWIALHSVLLFLVPFIVHSLMGIEDMSSAAGREATRRAVQMLGWTSVTTIVAAIPAGRLADRYGRVRVLLLGMGLFAAGLIVGAFGRSIVTMGIVTPLAGIGLAAIQVIPFTLLPRLLPRGRTARFAALYTLSVELPRLAAALLGGGLIQLIGSYRAIVLISLPATLVAMLLFSGLAQHQREHSPSGA